MQEDTWKFRSGPGPVWSFHTSHYAIRSLTLSRLPELGGQKRTGQIDAAR